MKLQDSRHLKRERLRSGVKHVLEGKIPLPKARLELPPFFQREHHLCRPLAARYGESTFTIVEGFPEGDAPEDVIESHVDALCFHDEEYAKKLISTDDLIVRVLRGTCTVTRRFFQWLDPVDIFTLGGRPFTVVDVRRERVGDVDEPEARREGVANLAEWRRSWVDNLPASAGAVDWKPDVICVRHEFVASDLAK